MKTGNESHMVYIDGLPSFSIGNLTGNLSFVAPLDYREYIDDDDNQAAPPPAMYQPPPMDAMMITLNQIIYILKMYYTPIIVLVGILGNIVSVAMMLRTKLKLLSFVHYMAAIFAADILFLLNLLCLWVVDMGINLYQLGAWCHFTTFLSHSSGFLSLWYTVCLAVDRLIYVHFALLERKLCTTTRAKVLVITLALTAVAVFLNMSLLVEVFYMGHVAVCIPVRQYMAVLRKLNHVDTFINVLLPYSVLLVIFLLGTVKTYREYRWMRVNGRARSSRPTYECDHERGQVKASFSFLMYFLLLTLPLQAFRVTLTMREMLHPLAMPDLKLMLWQQILHYPYYTRFSLNFLVIVATYRGFRSSTRGAISPVCQCLQSVLVRRSDDVSDVEGSASACQLDEAAVALCEIKDSD